MGPRRNGAARSKSLSTTDGAAPIIIDCTVRNRPQARAGRCTVAHFVDLCDASRVRIACDLPSGVESDSGAELSAVPVFDLTVTFGALKPAHRLNPAMHKCGRVVLADIGIDADEQWHEIGPPTFRRSTRRAQIRPRSGSCPRRQDAGRDRARGDSGGAGGRWLCPGQHVAGDPSLPAAVVQVDIAEVNDERIGCLLVGPGMGDIPQVLTLALTSKAPKVIDADGISHLGEPERLKGQDAIITPHEGEFRRLFGQLEGAKPERALEAARRTGAVVVYKGPDTMVASPDGRLGFAPPAPASLASPGPATCCGDDCGAAGAGLAGVRGGRAGRVAARAGGGDRGAEPDRRRSCGRDPAGHG